MKRVRIPAENEHFASVAPGHARVPGRIPKHSERASTEDDAEPASVGVYTTVVLRVVRTRIARRTIDRSRRRTHAVRKVRQESSNSSFNRSRDLVRRNCVPMAIRPASPLSSIDHGSSVLAGPGVEDPFPVHASDLHASRLRCTPRAGSDWVRTVTTHARNALALPLRADAESVPPSPHASRVLASGRRSYLPQLGARPADGRRSLRKFF